MQQSSGFGSFSSALLSGTSNCGKDSRYCHAKLRGLATSLVLNGFLPLGRNLKCTAICAVKEDQSSLSKILASFVIFYLAMAYWAALAYIFPNAEIKFMTWFNIRPALWIEKVLGPMGIGYGFQERFMRYKPIPALRISFFLQFSWWAAILGVSVWVRAIGGKIVRGTEAIWTFGQMLALLMITLPFLTAAEIYLGMIKSAFIASYLEVLPSSYSSVIIEDVILNRLRGKENRPSSRLNSQHHFANPQSGAEYSASRSTFRHCYHPGLFRRNPPKPFYS